MTEDGRNLSAKRSCRTLKAQQEVYIEYLNQNRDFTGKKNPRRPDLFEMHWTALAKKLNAEGPPVRSSQTWRKLLRGWKNQVRSRARLIAKDRAARRVSKLAPLTEIEERALDVWGPVTTESVIESNGSVDEIDQLSENIKEEIVLMEYEVREMSSIQTSMTFETLLVKQQKPFVFHVELNRPDRLNAFNPTMWQEIKDCFHDLSDNPDCRAIVLSGSGKHFTSGLDLRESLSTMQEIANTDDVGRKGYILGKKIRHYQESVSSLEKCRKPVIVAVHSACIGAGVDFITSADIRYCTDDAWFSVMEVNIGMAADVGTLQRLPRVIGNQSLIRELCYTGRKLPSAEAYQCGLVSRTFKTKDEMLNEAIKLAEEIASKSPIAVQATKKSMIYSMDHTIQDGLNQIADVNQLFLQSEDFINACMAQATKGDPPVFSKL